MICQLLTNSQSQLRIPVGKNMIDTVVVILFTTTNIHTPEQMVLHNEIRVLRRRPEHTVKITEATSEI
ncbi:MAG: hypothetical protein CMI67_17795 [Pelagibaca sp.]|nr:hypothetical protein [Pelagibaca sp.]